MFRKFLLILIQLSNKPLSLKEQTTFFFMKLKPVLQVFGGLAIVLTLLPLIAIDYWWIRIFDFPHIQLTILTFTALITYFMRFEIKRVEDYTPFADFEVLEAKNNNPEKTISLYTANVYQKNKEKQKLIQDIKKHDADILLFVETNTSWKENIDTNISEDYKYDVSVPLDNTYGMLLYSKLKLIEPEVKYLVDKGIPSIHTQVLLNSGDTIQLYTIHPTPPMPQHNPKSSDRDAEMMKIANLSRKSKYPVLVIGDFNDVAWSATTSLFYNVAELLDVRKGRGFYNTFDAKSFIMRWPLDHIFISSEFRAIDISLGSDINSDHFPTYTKLSFEPENAAEQQPKKPTQDQLERAKEQANGVQKVELDM